MLIYIYIYICTYIYIYIYIYICMLINIDNILTNIGHRFVHLSGLDESSGQKSTLFRHRIAFRVYLMFSKIDKNTTYWQILTTSRPLYGGGSGVCVYFVYVYIVLCFFGLLWVPFEALFLLLGWLWVFLGHFGQPLDHFGMPWNDMEVALVRPPKQI